MYCPYCGSELPDDAIYCNQCGRKVPDIHSENHAEPGHQFEQENEPQPVASTVSNNSNPTKTIIIVCVIAAVIFCVGIIGIPAIIDSFSKESSDSILGMWKSTTSYYDSDSSQYATIYYTFDSNGVGTQEWYNTKGVQYYSRVMTWSGKNDVYTIREIDTQKSFTFSVTGDTAHVSYGVNFVKTTTKTPTPVPMTTFVPVKTQTKTPTPVPTSTFVPVKTPTQQQDDTIKRVYSWDYNGRTFTGTFYFSKSTYNYYRSLGHGNSNLAKYATDSTNRKIVSEIASLISDKADELGYSDYEAAMLAVTFVQSLPYTSDKVTTGADEYVRYPIETLVDNGGDCEDSSILAAAIIREMGYGCALLRFDGHVAVGVKGGDGIYGTYFLKDGDKYFYLETTGRNWDVGEIPNDYKSQKAAVIIIN